MRLNIEAKSKALLDQRGGGRDKVHKISGDILLELVILFPNLGNSTDL